jgi:hypothetical protein
MNAFGAIESVIIIVLSGKRAVGPASAPPTLHKMVDEQIFNISK